MPSAHEHIGAALDLLTKGLYPYFEGEMKMVFHDAWQDVARTSLRSERNVYAVDSPPIHWDAHAILSVMWDQWNAVFRQHLSLTERSLVGELKEFRNRWAHQTSFTEDDAYRVCDSVQRLLLAVNADEAALDVDHHKWDILRDKLGQKLNDEIARSQASRTRMMDVALYSSCGLSICAAALTMFGQRHFSGSLIFSAFVLFAFGYFIYQRITRSVPVFGVHECHKCRKVIYTEVCPYCDPAVRPSSSVLRNSSTLTLPPIRETAGAGVGSSDVR